MGSSDETPSADGDPTQSTIIDPGQYLLFLNMVWSAPISLITKPLTYASIGASCPTPAHHTTPPSQPSDANAGDFTTILTTFLA